MSRGGAGRGRGRGRGNIGATMDAMGVQRDEIPNVVVHPPELFPSRSFLPMPLTSAEKYDEMAEIEEEFKSRFRSSRFYLDDEDDSKRIVRYSDKYERSNKFNSGSTAKPMAWDPKVLPAELLQTKKSTKATMKQKPKTTIVPSKPRSPTNLAAVEGDGGNGPPDKADDEQVEDDEEAVEPEVFDEEIDEEEENDYNLSYFDNGESYLDQDSDDNDGPTY